MTHRRPHPGPPSARRQAFAGVILLTLACGSAIAQPRPARTAIDAASDAAPSSVVDVRIGSPTGVEAIQIRPKGTPAAPRPATQPAAARSAAAAPRISDVSFDFTRILYSLAIVLAVIFAFRFIAKRFFNLPTGTGPAGPVQVLSRSMLSPKQQLMLIRVGNRVILVANCGAQVNPLCEISDPDEVASLMAQTRQRPTESPANPFVSWFGKAANAYGTPPQGNIESEEAMPPPDEADVPESADPAMANTKEDLNGLLEKVRLLSQSYRKT